MSALGNTYFGYLIFGNSSLSSLSSDEITMSIFIFIQYLAKITKGTNCQVVQVHNLNKHNKRHIMRDKASQDVLSSTHGARGDKLYRRKMAVACMCILVCTHSSLNGEDL